MKNASYPKLASEIFPKCLCITYVIVTFPIIVWDPVCIHMRQQIKTCQMNVVPRHLGKVFGYLALLEYPKKFPKNFSQMTWTTSDKF